MNNPYWPPGWPRNPYVLYDHRSRSVQGIFNNGRPKTLGQLNPSYTPKSILYKPGQERRWVWPCSYIERSIQANERLTLYSYPQPRFLKERDIEEPTLRGGHALSHESIVRPGSPHPRAVDPEFDPDIHEANDGVYQYDTTRTKENPHKPDPNYKHPVYWDRDATCLQDMPDGFVVPKTRPLWFRRKFEAPLDPAGRGQKRKRGTKVAPRSSTPGPYDAAIYDSLPRKERRLIYDLPEKNGIAKFAKIPVRYNRFEVPEETPEPETPEEMDISVRFVPFPVDTASGDGKDGDDNDDSSSSSDSDSDGGDGDLGSKYTMPGAYPDGSENNCFLGWANDSNAPSSVETVVESVENQVNHSDQAGAGASAEEENVQNLRYTLGGLDLNNSNPDIAAFLHAEDAERRGLTTPAEPVRRPLRNRANARPVRTVHRRPAHLRGRGATPPSPGLPAASPSGTPEVETAVDCTKQATSEVNQDVEAIRKQTLDAVVSLLRQNHVPEPSIEKYSKDFLTSDYSPKDITDEVERANAVAHKEREAKEAHQEKVMHRLFKRSRFARQKLKELAEDGGARRHAVPLPYVVSENFGSCTESWSSDSDGGAQRLETDVDVSNVVDNGSDDHDGDDEGANEKHDNGNENNDRGNDDSGAQDQDQDDEGGNGNDHANNGAPDGSDDGRGDGNNGTAPGTPGNDQSSSSSSSGSAGDDEGPGGALLNRPPFRTLHTPALDLTTTALDEAWAAEQAATMSALATAQAAHQRAPFAFRHETVRAAFAGLAAQIARNPDPRAQTLRLDPTSLSCPATFGRTGTARVPDHTRARPPMSAAHKARLEAAAATGTGGRFGVRSSPPRFSDPTWNVNRKAYRWVVESRGHVPGYEVVEEEEGPVERVMLLSEQRVLEPVRLPAAGLERVLQGARVEEAEIEAAMAARMGDQDERGEYQDPPENIMVEDEVSEGFVQETYDEAAEAEEQATEEEDPKPQPQYRY
ncbi:hypothetical protein C1H76_5842 [Elsinoe australis]|uniref:Uncharacterized protein n=1 Tax=Elsinoe australis TaxID=40998 RepID=A0A4U7AV01_9PEZI|nr:hypothetical protein C1H76_5842 [Elsinoe australis]